MKIRFGFVTNSSCGNYILAVDADGFLKKLMPLIDKYELEVIEIAEKPYVVIDAHTSIDNREGLHRDYGHNLFALRLQFLRDLSGLKLNVGVSEFRVSESTSDYLADQKNVDRMRELLSIAEFTHDWREEPVKLDLWHQVVSNFKPIPLGRCPECGQEVCIESLADAPWPLWTYYHKGMNLSPVIDQAFQTVEHSLKEETNLIPKLTKRRLEVVQELWETAYSKGSFFIQNWINHGDGLCSSRVRVSVEAGVVGDVDFVCGETETPQLKDCILYPRCCLLEREGRSWMRIDGSDTLPQVDGFYFNDIDPYNLERSLSRFIFKAFSPEIIVTGNEKLNEIITDRKAEGGVDTKRSIAEYIMLIIPLSQFVLSVKTSQCLQNEGVRFIGDLVTLAEDKLLSIKGFGKRSLDESRELINSLGLSFEMKLTAVQHAILEEARRSQPEEEPVIC